MRRCLSVGLVIALTLSSVPLSAASARARVGVRQDQAQTGTIKGTAQSAKGEALPNYKVRVRDTKTGVIAAELLADASGTFMATGLTAGTYAVEIVSAAGEIVGISSAITVAAGAIATVTVTATAVGAVAAAAAAGGFSLLGLGTAASVAVVTAAGVASVAGIVAAKSNASPSQ